MISPIDSILPASEQAVHEAAHAVFAAYLKLPLVYATIRRAVDSGGHVKMGQPSGVRLYVSEHRAGLPTGNGVMKKLTRFIANDWRISR